MNEEYSLKEYVWVYDVVVGNVGVINFKECLEYGFILVW